MPKALPRSAVAFRRALATWFQDNRRKLPWRESPSLYGTVVSEFMLQQTQIKTALPYYERWMRELPDFKALASASGDRVMKLWEGLGYYSRARNLHRLAQELIALPEIPRTAEAWRNLPGIGPYTSAAITSIAFGQPEACVDGNVVRILARLSGETTEFRDSATASKFFAPLAAQLLDHENSGKHNEAMMELGAIVCHRQNPLCDGCPVCSFCLANKRGYATTIPRFVSKQVERISITRIWCLHKGRLLLHLTKSSARRLANLHELPSVADLEIPPQRIRNAPILAKRRRSITRFQILETIHSVSAADLPGLAQNPSLRWVPVGSLDTVTFSGPHRRWVNELLAGYD